MSQSQITEFWKMANKDKNKVVEVIDKVINPTSQPTPIPCKLFVKNLKAELKKEKISPSVFNAFQMVANPVDLEKNYRELWKKTFKRA